MLNQQTLAWLTQSELRRSLPLQLRLFAVYCDLQRRAGLTGHIIGGLLAFRVLSRSAEALGASRAVRLHVGRHTVFVDARDPRLLHVPNELQPTAEATRVMSALLEPGDTFIDVGANHGSFSLVAAARLGSSGRVVAIEPQAELAQLIERSLAASARCPFEVLQVACGEVAGETALFVPRDSSGSAGVFAAFSATAPHRVVAVRVERLDDLLQHRVTPGRVLIKLDVEGSELRVLRGAAGFLRRVRPRVILEVNELSMTAAGLHIDELRSGLRELGFRRYLEVTALDRARSIADLEARASRNVVLLEPESEPLASNR
jgi:FkbM family methyltransferase